MKKTKESMDYNDIARDNEHILEGLKEKYRSQMPVG
jgi:hypothetical protein